MGSPTSLQSVFKNRAVRLLLLLPLLPFCTGMGKLNQPKISVRFYAEAQAQDSARFARPVKFENPPREGYIQQIPAIHEGMIKAVYPFQATDGTWGCAFRLDANGLSLIHI